MTFSQQTNGTVRAMDHNPLLKPWLRPRPDEAGGKGWIEPPGEVANIEWQTRAAPPTEYENQLGDALVACFGAGVVEVSALVARLNEMGVRAPDGTAWTVASFEREMARLGG
jgi:hypothetical protein